MRMNDADQLSNSPTNLIEAPPCSGCGVADAAKDCSGDCSAAYGPRFDQISNLIYDLRGSHASSDACCADVAAFSTRLLNEIEAQAGAALDAYGLYVRDRLHESPRSRGEYAIELLALGMMVKLYARAAAGTPGWVVELARELLWLRRRYQNLKPAADFLRAVLFRVFSVGKLGVATSTTPAFETLAHLIEWLHATGEFEQEAMRLDNWKSYLSTLPHAEIDTLMQTSMDLFEWFRQEAAGALGSYTMGVEHFLNTAYAQRGVREDQIFCGRKPVEYHVGMVAAEIMNRGLRDEFEQTPRKVVLLPACMKGARAEQCRASTHGVEINCSGCDKDCTVNRITRRMRRLGVEVYLVPHTTGFSRWLVRWQNQREVGVVAVACISNILAGGFEMRARSIASQCVLLDFPGCQKHWSGVRITTAVNEEQLVNLLRAG
jgi:hypothetical protein